MSKVTLADGVVAAQFVSRAVGGDAAAFQHVGPVDQAQRNVGVLLDDQGRELFAGAQLAQQLI